jgi:hypothetical protein
VRDFASGKGASSGELLEHLPVNPRSRGDDVRLATRKADALHSVADNVGRQLIGNDEIPANSDSFGELSDQDDNPPIAEAGVVRDCRFTLNVESVPDISACSSMSFEPGGIRRLHIIERHCLTPVAAVVLPSSIRSSAARGTSRRRPMRIVGISFVFAA